MKCIQCNGLLELNEAAVITQVFKGETLRVKSPAYVCPSCGKPYLKETQSDILRRNIADEYRRQHRLLTSSEIKERRKALKLNQEQFAEFLRVSPVSIKRWETWQVQEQIYDQRIREK
jgi:putative zinc finger/helix-turn-helix YgiT family protein